MKKLNLITSLSLVLLLSSQENAMDIRGRFNRWAFSGTYASGETVKPNGSYSPTAFINSFVWGHASAVEENNVFFDHLESITTALDRWIWETARVNAPINASQSQRLDVLKRAMSRLAWSATPIRDTLSEIHESEIIQFEGLKIVLDRMIWGLQRFQLSEANLQRVDTILATLNRWAGNLPSVRLTENQIQRINELKTSVNNWIWSSDSQIGSLAPMKHTQEFLNSVLSKLWKTDKNSKTRIYFDIKSDDNVQEICAKVLNKAKSLKNNEQKAEFMGHIQDKSLNINTPDFFETLLSSISTPSEVKVKVEIPKPGFASGAKKTAAKNKKVRHMQNRKRKVKTTRRKTQRKKKVAKKRKFIKRKKKFRNIVKKRTT
ncbi:MAG TPA: hypothetical protein VJ201_08725 [Candidatus Babeliales bacterium]|nr:hypothetical protein [Candidatus Babeliales bacterium]